MYTFQAIESINTINYHGGFYIIASVCAFCVAMCLVATYGTGSSPVEFILSLAIISALAAGVSYNTGSITTYANTKVEATLVGFQAEGWQASSGKSRPDHHETYVVYATPAGNVMLPALTGIDYPRTAILYKN